LVDKTDGNRLSPTSYQAGEVVEVYAEQGLARNGDGSVVVYWLKGDNINLTAGQFELIDEIDVSRRIGALNDRHGRYLSTAFELQNKLDAAKAILTEVEWQLCDPRHR
jgi:hypothetical protein